MPSSTTHPARSLLLGGVAIATLDLLFAWGFWAPRGATLPDILQSIAAGWFGPRSHSMGTTSIVAGALSHTLIAYAFVLAYWLAARRWPVLARRPYAFGIAYGLVLYAAMNLVVVPLSAAGMPKFDDIPWVAASIAMHAVFGVMSALFARRALL